MPASRVCFTEASGIEGSKFAQMDDGTLVPVESDGTPVDFEEVYFAGSDRKSCQSLFALCRPSGLYHS